MNSPIGSKNNVKIFVLYLMQNINYPLDFLTINDIIMQSDFVMYLDFAECFNDMIDQGLIISYGKDEKGETLYVVSEAGKTVANELNKDIVHSILDKSLECALRYIDFKKRGVSVKCMCEKKGNLFLFTCKLIEGNNELLSTSVLVDSLEKAEKMKENFTERPEGIYRATLALLSGNVNYLL